MGRYPFHSLLEQERERDYEIALDALDKVGMKSYRDRNFQSLSGGEKQRVVLARALTQSPKILILDEPTNHLDIRYRLEILSIIKELHVTVLAALHDLSLAAQFCDHLYLMKQGEIVTQGQPQAVVFLTVSMLRLEGSTNFNSSISVIVEDNVDPFFSYASSIGRL